MKTWYRSIGKFVPQNLKQFNIFVVKFYHLTAAGWVTGRPSIQTRTLQVIRKRSPYFYAFVNFYPACGGGLYTHIIETSKWVSVAYVRDSIGALKQDDESMVTSSHDTRNTSGLEVVNRSIRHIITVRTGTAG